MGLLQNKIWLQPKSICIASGYTKKNAACQPVIFFRKIFHGPFSTIVNYRCGKVRAKDLLPLEMLRKNCFRLLIHTLLKSPTFSNGENKYLGPGKAKTFFFGKKFSLL